jgi:hypothetical protein
MASTNNAPAEWPPFYHGGRVVASFSSTTAGHPASFIGASRCIDSQLAIL